MTTAGKPWEPFVETRGLVVLLKEQVFEALNFSLADRRLRAFLAANIGIIPTATELWLADDEELVDYTLPGEITCLYSTKTQG